MGITFTVPTEGINRIRSKLMKTMQEIEKPSSAVYKYKIVLLNEYKQAVASAMGSVSARGGNAVLSFQGDTKAVYWKNLSPRTLARKAIRLGLISPSGLSGYKEAKAAAYANFKNEFRIWVDTGDTRGSVDVYETDGFAGIRGNAETMKRAYQTEFGIGSTGKPMPARGLFTIINAEFVRAKLKIMEHVKADVVATAIQCGWGASN
jgi:hypothetical protein